MPAAVGFWYHQDGYDVSRKRLMGRHSAGESFLRALVQHCRAAQLYCVAPSREQHRDCAQRVRDWKASRPIEYVLHGDAQRLAQAGILYRPDPGLAVPAWARRHVGQRLYSICGITHTTCTKAVMDSIGQLAIAPVQAWDALICTSSAVKRFVERTIGDWSEYLALRCEARLHLPIRLPVIPLGVDANSFAPSSKTKAMRAGLRAALTVSEQGIVILYVGRLSFYSKAHPIPMYMALQRVAERTQRPLWLLQVGWFENEREENAFAQSAKALCPSVQIAFLDGRRPELRRQAWAAADIFVSLSDNIQETFGLTPLEGMAAGLPVVCSDWDGYQDTVRQEIDGFRVAVWMPPSGSGEELACDYLINRIPYHAYVGRVCQSTAVDIDAVTKAILTLVENPALRRKMGRAGRLRASREFDWSAIMRRYEALWDQLQELRRAETEAAPRAPGAPAHPLCADPFHAFSHYTTQEIRPDVTIRHGIKADETPFGELTQDPMVVAGSDQRFGLVECAEMLRILERSGPTTIRELSGYYKGRERQLYRTIGWMMKFDMVAIDACN